MPVAAAAAATPGVGDTGQGRTWGRAGPPGKERRAGEILGGNEGQGAEQKEVRKAGGRGVQGGEEQRLDKGSCLRRLAGDRSWNHQKLFWERMEEGDGRQLFPG